MTFCCEALAKFYGLKHLRVRWTVPEIIKPRSKMLLLNVRNRKKSVFTVML